MTIFKSIVLPLALLLVAGHSFAQRYYVRSYESESDGGKRLLKKMYWALSFATMNLELRDKLQWHAHITSALRGRSNEHAQFRVLLRVLPWNLPQQ